LGLSISGKNWIPMDLNFVPPPGATSSVALATSCPQPFPGPVLHQGGEANDRQRTGALRAFEMGWDMADQLDMVDMYSRYAYIFVYIYIYLHLEYSIMKIPIKTLLLAQ
jgi:hypothetical protein